MEKEHTALEELFHCVLIVPLVKLWEVVMVFHRMTVLGVSRDISILYIYHILSGNIFKGAY